MRKVYLNASWLGSFDGDSGMVRIQREGVWLLLEDKWHLFSIENRENYNFHRWLTDQRSHYISKTPDLVLPRIYILFDDFNRDSSYRRTVNSYHLELNDKVYKNSIKSYLDLKTFGIF